MILSRRVADIFIPSRSADYTWEGLFGSVFECDEELVPAVGLRSTPWKQYKWKIGGA